MIAAMAAGDPPFRLQEPDALRALLEDAGFAVRVLHDNREFRESDLRGAPGSAADLGGMGGRKLYVAAVRE